MSDLSYLDLFRTVERAKREWESTVDTLSDLIVVVDSDLKIIRANRTIEDWAVGRVEQLNGKNLHDVLHPTCRTAACYLLVAFQTLAIDQFDRTVQTEARDLDLNRDIRLVIQPIRTDWDDHAMSAVVSMSDITKLKMAEQAREDLIADLDAFAHTVAHDLKNPIGTIIGFADLLSERSLPPEDVEQAIQAIRRIGRKMNNIVEELMFFSKVRSADVARNLVDTSAILNEALGRLEIDLRQSGAEVIIHQGLPAAIGYGPWIEEVWVNFITNAIKYGGTPPRIELGGEQLTDGLVRFWVNDNGAGIKPELAERIFSAQPHITPMRSGSHGFGLSIVRRIVEKLGGRAWVESDPAACPGSTFYFTLPAAAVLPAEPAAVALPVDLAVTINRSAAEEWQLFDAAVVCYT